MKEKLDHVYHNEYTLCEILSAIETLFRLYFFSCKERDHIPTDLSDFSLAEL